MGPLKRVCIKADGAPVPLCVGIHSLGAAVWLLSPALLCGMPGLAGRAGRRFRGHLVQLSGCTD